MSLLASASTFVGREREIALSATTRRATSKAGPELTIVVPTLNERDNVGPLIDRLDRMLGGVDWEAVFVDDDSNETAEHPRDVGRTDRRICCIRRFGRRGLSSACIGHRLCVGSVDRDGDGDGLELLLNNTLTYRDSRLVGWATLRGLVSFMLICGLGGCR